MKFMNFEKLYDLVLEAGFRPDAPKNQGGNRLYRAKNSEGPGMPSIDQGTRSEFGASSVGRNDNPESYVPTDIKKKYGVDPERLGTSAEMGYEEIAAARSKMRTAFALLFNSKHFFSNFKKNIQDRLSIDSISAEDEREWNRAKDEADARKTETTGLRNELSEIDRLYRQMDEYKEEKDVLERRIEYTKEQIKNAVDEDDKQIYATDLEETMQELKDVNSGLSTMKPHELEKRRRDTENKLRSHIELELEANKKWEEIQDKISNVSANNIKSGENTLRGMKGEIKRAAEGLFDMYRTLNDIPEDELQRISADWDKNPNTIIEKLKMLHDLTTDKNPVVDFINKIQRQFDDKYQDMDDNYMNKNININMMRIFEKLPAVIMAKYFNTIAGRGVERKTIPLNNLEVSKVYASVNDLKDALKELDSKEKWDKGQKKLLALADALPFNTGAINAIKSQLKGYWSTNREGISTNEQIIRSLSRMEKNSEELKSAATKETRSKDTLKESFDQVANRYMKQFSFDEKDYKLDLIEVVGMKRKGK